MHMCMYMCVCLRLELVLKSKRSFTLRFGSRSGYRYRCEHLCAGAFLHQNVRWERICWKATIVNTTCPFLPTPSVSWYGRAPSYNKFDQESGPYKKIFQNLVAFLAVVCKVYSTIRMQRTTFKWCNPNMRYIWTKIVGQMTNYRMRDRFEYQAERCPAALGPRGPTQASSVAGRNSWAGGRQVRGEPGCFSPPARDFIRAVLLLLG